MFLVLDNCTLALQCSAIALTEIFNKLALGVSKEEEEEEEEVEVVQSKGILAVVAVGEDFTAVRLQRETLQNGRVLNSEIKFEFLHLNTQHRNCSSLYTELSSKLLGREEEF